MRFFVEMGENEEKPAAKWALRETDEERPRIQLREMNEER